MLKTAESHVQCKLSQGIVVLMLVHDLDGFVDAEIRDVGRNIQAKLFVEKLCEKTGGNAAVSGNIVHGHFLRIVLVDVIHGHDDMPVAADIVRGNAVVDVPRDQDHQLGKVEIQHLLPIIRVLSGLLDQVVYTVGEWTGCAALQVLFLVQRKV